MTPTGKNRPLQPFVLRGKGRRNHLRLLYFGDRRRLPPYLRFHTTFGKARHEHFQLREVVL